MKISHMTLGPALVINVMQPTQSHDIHMTHLELRFQDLLGNADVQHLHHAQHLLHVQRAIAVLVSFLKQIPQPPSI